MVRLVLEENGKRRAFRVGDGVLKIGSGAAASLRLEDPIVAELHAELEIVSDHALLRLEAGAAPPEIDGETVLGDVTLQQGQGLVFGEALIWIEDEGLEAGAGRPASAPGIAQPGADASAAQRAGASASQKAAAGRKSSGSRRPKSSPSPSRDAARQRAIERASGQDDRSRVQRTRPRGKKGIPTPLLLGIVGVILLIAGFAVMKGFKVANDTVGSTPNVLLAAERAVAQARFLEAEDTLLILSADRLNAAETARVRQIHADIAEGRKSREAIQASGVGTAWLDSQLKNYEGSTLQGNPTKAQIRLFLERCQEFRRRWPRHGGIEWISRQEGRFGGAVNLTDPLTIQDVDWQVDLILRGTPRKYKLAFRMIDAFLAHSGTSSRDAEVARAKRKEIEEERIFQFDENLKWAAYYYKNEDKSKEDETKAVQRLVYSVAFMDDAEMEVKAMEYLRQMPNLKAHMDAYQASRPDVFDLLIENSDARALCVELGVL
ncbi:MAG: hypothetical protein ACI8QS_001079 [Planctomycetota bacterium]|jgi:hypothetical protein